MSSNDILSVAEVATELRCSKTHVYKAIRGRVAGVSKLPAISMGRRLLVRRTTLEAWKTANEGQTPGGMMPLPGINAARRVEGGGHA